MSTRHIDHKHLAHKEEEPRGGVRKGQRNDNTLHVFGLYRIILAALLLLVFLVQQTGIIDRAYRPDLLLTTISLYFILNIATHFYTGFQQYHLSDGVLFVLFFLVDICALTLIAHASGTFSNSLSLLMTTTVASAGIFYRDRLAFLVAALATIATLLNSAALLQQQIANNGTFLTAGFLGILFFTTALLIQRLVTRIDYNQRLVDQKAKELAYTEHLNRLIVQRMQTGVVVLDKTRKIQSANTSAIELLQLPTQQNPLKKSIPGFLLDNLLEWETKPLLRTAPFNTPNGGLQIQAEFMSLKDDDAGNILIFLEDTSRARQQAQQFKLASLGRLTASIAHEIRNPLGAISHAAQLLNESQEIREEDKRLCDIINHHCKRMNRIIENVLQLSRRKATEPERINLQEWLQGFITLLLQQNPSSRINFKATDQPCDVAFDASQLEQVLTNICTNGLRYSKARIGEARLDLLVSMDDTHTIPYLEVIDYGHGVDKQHLEKLFEPFYTNEKNGTGLGLFIAKELCEANQARLNYLPTTDGKSCFRIAFAHPQKKLPTPLPTLEPN